VDWVGFGQSADGLGWVGSHKMDPRTTLSWPASPQNVWTEKYPGSARGPLSGGSAQGEGMRVGGLKGGGRFPGDLAWRRQS